MKTYIPIVAFAFVSAGCGSKSTPATETAPPAPRTTVTSEQASTPTPPVAKAPETITPDAQTTKSVFTAAPSPAPAAVPSAPIPTALKSPAYDYYGLGYEKPIDYELTGDDSAGVRTGSQTTTLVSVKDGKAKFSQTRTGGLEIMGNDELLLDDEGVHVSSSTVETVDPKNLEFPSDVTPGKSWTSHDKINQTGMSFEITTHWTIKGTQQLQTKRGKLEALLITSTGEGTENGQKMRMESETYYVKGIGLAKAVIRTTTGSGKHSSITQQLAN